MSPGNPFAVVIVLLACACAPQHDVQREQQTPTKPPVSTPPAASAADHLLAAALQAAEAGVFQAESFPGIATHPAYGWVEYAALRRDLRQVAPAQAQTFLSRYQGQAVAETFRATWLQELARRQQWRAFLQAWSSTIQDVSLRCAQLSARAAAGGLDARWDADAQAIWRSAGKALPDACDAPLLTLAARGGLPPALRWERIELAAAEGQAGVMRAAAQGLPADAFKLAQAYATFIANPRQRELAWPQTPRSRTIAAFGLARLANADPTAAEAQLARLAPLLGFTEVERGRVAYAIALWTVASYQPESARRLAAVPASAYDERLHEWRVREALARSDWNAALAALTAMGQAQRDDSRWTYFQARLLELTGDQSQAQTLYRRAAMHSEFHGFLAADRLRQPYALCPWQLNDSAQAKTLVAQDPALVRAFGLWRIQRKNWAEREWKDALTRFSPTQRHLAVEAAQAMGWFDRGVFGLVNVDGRRYADESKLYSLRFPLHHDAIIRREAQRNRLDPAWVAAEIRAESVFDPRARSSADARGLMQVLPSTAAAVAQAIGQPWTGGESLYNPDTNIVLGTAYLRQLMDRYGGKPYQVIAGYNAGPAPLNRWISQRPAMDADFWIETISYKETRDYVARVLAFSVIYDWRLNGNALHLTDRMQGATAGQRVAFACPTPTAAD